MLSASFIFVQRICPRTHSWAPITPFVPFNQTRNYHRWVFYSIFHPRCVPGECPVFLSSYFPIASASAAMRHSSPSTTSATSSSQSFWPLTFSRQRRPPGPTSLHQSFLFRNIFGSKRNDQVLRPVFQTAIYLRLPFEFMMHIMCMTTQNIVHENRRMYSIRDIRDLVHTIVVLFGMSPSSRMHAMSHVQTGHLHHIHCQNTFANGV